MRLSKREAWAAMSLYGDPAKAGLEEPKPKRSIGHPERDVLNAIMSMLRVHPKVAWRVRMNSGGFTDGHGQFVRFGFVGCPDIWGQLKNGKILCIEVKAAKGAVTEAQAFFLDRVKRHGGHAGVARSVEDALRIVEVSQVGPDAES